MLLKELRTIFVVQLAWIYMLVVMFINVLLGGLGYGTLQPQCARVRMASTCTLAELQAVAKFLCNYSQEGKDVVQEIE